MNLTQEENELCSAIGFDPAVLDLVRSNTGATPQRLVGITEDDEEVPVDGLSFDVRRDDVEGLLRQLQPVLGPMGYRAFWSERRLTSGMAAGDELAILKTADPYAILHARQTDGANYGVFLPDILARLDAWKSICQFEVVGAASDWVALTFLTLPPELCAFAEEIYSFCPDSVEQGIGLVREHDDPQLYARARTICPEYTSRTPQAAGKSHAQTVADEIRSMFGPKADELTTVFGFMSPDEVRSMLGQRDLEQPDEDPKNLKRLGSDIDDPVLALVEMGIRLLAAEIERSRYLFLWWD
ncbi:MAG TPA: DUF4253 domain-containing protein [Armatimonadota bacterium]|nr:DUF4253 domain-containing protein [Armatimonadota bacterium]